MIFRTITIATVVVFHSVSAKDFVWRVQNNNSLVYLAGSVHLLRQSDYPLPATFDAAFKAADQIVFEADLDQLASPTVRDYIQKNGFYSGGATIRSGGLAGYLPSTPKLCADTRQSNQFL